LSKIIPIQNESDANFAAHPPYQKVRFRANGSHQLNEADPVKRAAYLGIVSPLIPKNIGGAS